LKENFILALADQFKNMKPKQEVDKERHNEVVQEESESPSQKSGSENG